MYDVKTVLMKRLFYGSGQKRVASFRTVFLLSGFCDILMSSILEIMLFQIGFVTSLATVFAIVITSCYVIDQENGRKKNGTYKQG